VALSDIVIMFILVVSERFETDNCRELLLAFYHDHLLACKHVASLWFPIADMVLIWLLFLTSLKKHSIESTPRLTCEPETHRRCFSPLL